MVLTFFFAQLLGLIMVVMALSLFTQRRMYLGMVAAFRENRASQFAASFTGLLLGGVLLLTHNVWSGGLLPFLVSLIGWMIFLKSVALLLLPTSLWGKIMKPVATRRAFIIAASAMLVIGLYLFLAGAGGR